MIKNKKGFSLIELLAVIVILGILLSISIVAVNSIRKKQEKENVRNIISSMLTGAKNYVSEHPEVISNLSVVYDGKNDPNNENGYNVVYVSIEELLDGNYVDFDQNKYKDLIYYGGGDNRTVAIRSCSSTGRWEDNQNKLVYIYWYYEENPNSGKEAEAVRDEAIKYTDCGCRAQSQGASKELCEEEYVYDENGKIIQIIDK